MFFWDMNFFLFFLVNSFKSDIFFVLEFLDLFGLVNFFIGLFFLNILWKNLDFLFLLELLYIEYFDGVSDKFSILLFFWEIFIELRYFRFWVFLKFEFFFNFIVFNVFNFLKFVFRRFIFLLGFFFFVVIWDFFLEFDFILWVCNWFLFIDKGRDFLFLLFWFSCFVRRFISTC